jgi:hypothetical protein
MKAPRHSPVSSCAGRFGAAALPRKVAAPFYPSLARPHHRENDGVKPLYESPLLRPGLLRGCPGTTSQPAKCHSALDTLQPRAESNTTGAKLRDEGYT